MYGIDHLPEAMYLEGEKQAELAELRNDPKYYSDDELAQGAANGN